jgi:hypothetical protein
MGGAKTCNIFDRVFAAICERNDMVYLRVCHPFKRFENRMRTVTNFATVRSAFSSDRNH